MGTQRFLIIALDRTNTIFVVFQYHGFHDVPRVLITGVRSFQAFSPAPTWTDSYTWPRSHAGFDLMPDKMNYFRLSQAALL